MVHVRILQEYSTLQQGKLLWVASWSDCFKEGYPGGGGSLSNGNMLTISIGTIQYS